MGTWEGLGVPLFGEYYRYNSAQTEVLYVENDGVHNFTFTDQGGENCIALTITDSTTVTSGYSQGFYVNHTVSGSWSTGAAQINSFAVDLALTGTIACEAEGFYAYVSGSGATLTSANISGVVCYIADLGAEPTASRAALKLHIADGNKSSGNDAFIVMRIEGASGDVTNMFEKSGTATNPDNFIRTNATDGMLTAGDYLGGTPASAYGLRFLVGATVYYIPLIADS